MIWAILAGTILLLPVLGALRRFRWAAFLTGLVVLECGVLALNGGRCPLTDLAAKFTSNRADNFDIYLPIWLARFIKAIFGRRVDRVRKLAQRSSVTSPRRVNAALH